MAGRRFLVSCTHCKRTVVIVTRIAEADAERLRMHLRACCPGKVVGLPPGVEAALRHFRIKATDPGAEPPPGTA